MITTLAPAGEHADDTVMQFIGIAKLQFNNTAVVSRYVLLFGIFLNDFVSRLHFPGEDQEGAPAPRV